jgi:hypothetical protein
MACPKLLLGNAVMRWTESDQIIEIVRFSVVSKEAKRLDVVDGQARSNHAATLTGVVVSLARGSALPDPVASAAFRMAAKPRRAIWPCPVVRLTPYAKAFAITKVVFLDRARLLVNLFSARKALHRHALSTDANPVCLLPFAVTGLTAKMPFRLLGQVRFGVVGFSALLTGEFNHSSLYAKSGQ